MKKKNIFKFAGLILFLLIVFYTFNFSDFGSNFKNLEGRLKYKEVLTRFILNFGFLSPIIFILVYIISTALMFPGTILSFVGATLFGTFKGFIFNLIGATIGASLSFLIARLLGKDFVESLFKNMKFYSSFENNGFNTILILRLIPIVPFNALDFASGVTKIKFKDYFFATLVGIIPGTFVYTYLFAILGIVAK